MKMCGRCQVELPLDDFHKRGKGHQSWCKSCRSSFDRERQRTDDYKARKNRYRKECKELVQIAKDKPCVDCGKRYPYYVMDLDHLPGHDKRDRLSRMVQDGVVFRVREEILKCEAVCANCHRERTHQRRVVA